MHHDENIDIRNMSFIEYLKYCRDGFDVEFFEDYLEGIEESPHVYTFSSDFSYCFNLDGTGADVATNVTMDEVFDALDSGKLKRYDGKILIYDGEGESIWILDFPYNSEEEVRKDVIKNFVS
jgi:hypothetical protein